MNNKLSHKNNKIGTSKILHNQTLKIVCVL